MLFGNTQYCCMSSIIYYTVRWSTTYYTNRMCSETGSLQLILDGPELAKTTKQYI